MIEPTGEQPAREAPKRGFMERLFGDRGPSAEASGASASESSAPANQPPPDRPPADTETAAKPAAAEPTIPEVGVTEAVSPSVVEIPRFTTPPAQDEGTSSELGQRVQTGFNDLSRLLSAIKETLQSRDGQVQQTLRALPDFLQQVPRIHRAEIECLAQISKQLQHMGTGTRDVVARLDGLPDLLRSLMLGQAEQAKFLDNLQANVAETLETQATALREGLETSRRSAETQLSMIKSIASTQEDIFATFQNTQNRALNVFHRAQQQTIAQNKETQKVMNKQIEMLVEKVHVAQGRVFWLSIGFAALAAAGLLAVVFFA
ncbi:MAG: hypothetical protein QNJ98_01930 [Planctomycetota bacterium]|nr:hypothetical protein [Planctomycetota bacterium]